MILTVLDRKYEIYVPWNHQGKVQRAASFLNELIGKFIKKQGYKLENLPEEEEKVLTIESLRKSIRLYPPQPKASAHKLIKGLARRIIFAISRPDFKWPSIRDEEKWNYEL